MTQGVRKLSRMFKKSWALVFPHFDIVLGVPVDYMHAVLFGVFKQLNSMSFTKAYFGYPWSCAKRINECDNKRFAVAPPNLIRRIPNSLEEFGTKYKVSEYRMWLLYYSALERVLYIC